MAAITSAVILEPRKIKSDTVSTCFSIYLPWVMGLDAMILVFLIWALSQLCHSPLSLSAIRVVSSAYLKLLVLLPENLIPACASSSPAFHMLYSAYKLSKQGDNIQPWRTPFLIWNLSIIPCLVLNVVTWSAYRFVKMQVRWSGIPISFKIFQFIVIQTVKGCGIVNKAEIDVLLEPSCFFDDPSGCWQLDLWFLCLF